MGPGGVTLNKVVQINDRAAALAELSGDQKKKLTAWSGLASRGTPYEANDLLQGAYVRWLASKKPVEGPDETYDYLFGAIKSIRSNHFKREKTVARYDGKRAFETEDDEETLVETAADPVETIESAVFQQQLFDLFRDDDEILELLIEQIDDAAASEIQAKLGWSKTKYETVQKRKKRLVAKYMSEGKLL
uniref:RNA polymerase, sigma-24 subunit, ECF subfamily n=1 Tax=Rhodopseudomonas palustris (strain BisA53) TaxID=316055 RepID=Q07NQ1_RHOP5